MGLSPAQFMLSQVIRKRPSGEAVSVPEAIFLSDEEVAEDATNGTLIGTLLTAGGVAPYSYSLTADPSSLLAIDGDSLEVADAFTGLEDYTFTVRTTDANSATFDQEFVLTVVAAIENDSGIGEGDGDVVIPDPEDPEVDQGGYEEPPVQQDTNEGLKIHGKNGGSATFLKDWGAPVAGAIYTMRYTADWSLMNRQGREAAIGFAFKDGNDFHLASLRGDGAVSTTMRKSKVYGDFRKANQFTITNDGAATHGTKDGPNWLRIKIADDGETYTLSTSANGSSWTAQYTAAVPTPLDAADDALQFGPGGYFTNQDKGVFSVVIEEFGEVQIPVNTVEPAISGAAMVGATLTATTGSWTGGVDSYAYQWKADGSNVGSDQNTYVPVSGDVGKVITVDVTATNAAGTSSPATSSGTSAVGGFIAAYSRAHDASGSYSVSSVSFGPAVTGRRLLLEILWTNRSASRNLTGVVVGSTSTAAVLLAESVPGDSSVNGELWSVDLPVGAGTSGTVDLTYSGTLNNDRGVSVAVYDATAFTLPRDVGFGRSSGADVTTGIVLPALPSGSHLLAGYLHADTVSVPATPTFNSGDLTNISAGTIPSVQAFKYGDNPSPGSSRTVNMASSSGANVAERLYTFSVSEAGPALNIALVTQDTAHAAATNTKANLEFFGHTVTLIADSAIGATNFSSYDLILAVRSTGTSSSSASSTVAGQLRTLVNGGKPLVVGGIFQGGTAGTGRSTIATHMNLTGTWRIINATDNGDEVVITNASHSITRGFNAVRVFVYGGQSLTVSLTAGQSYVGTSLATGDPDEATSGEHSIIAIPSGTTDLVAGTVGARVVVSDIPYAGQVAHSTSARLLINRMCQWAAGNI